MVSGPYLRNEGARAKVYHQHRTSHQTVSILFFANDRDYDFCRALLIIVLVRPNLSWAPDSHQLE